MENFVQEFLKLEDSIKKFEPTREEVKANHEWICKVLEELIGMLTEQKIQPSYIMDFVGIRNFLDEFSAWADDDMRFSHLLFLRNNLLLRFDNYSRLNYLKIPRGL